MELKRVKIERGWCYPLRITTDGSADDGSADSRKEQRPAIRWSYGPQARRLEDDVLLFDQVQKIGDFSMFKKFCEKFGLLMLWPETLTYLEQSGDRHLAEKTNFLSLAHQGKILGIDEMPEKSLIGLWDSCEANIIRLQQDLRNLASLRSQTGPRTTCLGRLPPRYPGFLAEGLNGAKIKVESNGSDLVLSIHAETLRQVCYLELASKAEFPVVECPTCGNLFMKRRRDKRYCSSTCRPRRETDLRKEKKRGYNRLNYLATRPEYRVQAQAIEERVHRDLRTAQSKSDVDAVIAFISGEKAKVDLAKRREA